MRKTEIRKNRDRVKTNILEERTAEENEEEKGAIRCLLRG